MSTLVENKKILLDYEIMESYEAGIELLGLEVKSLKQKHGNLLGSYVTIRHGEAFLINAHIPPYQEKNTPATYDPYQERKLLLKKAELTKLAGNGVKGLGKGLTIVPISMYNKNGKIKVQIAIVRGKKKYDKRQDLKKRQNERDIAREYGM